MEIKKEVTIFLVDDDKFFLDAFKHFLSDEDKTQVNIKTFKTGEACLQALDENPDIIILDYFLNSSDPEAMNGITVLKKIRSSHLHIPVIMLSSHDKVEVAIDAIKNGAFDYVIKSESAFIRIKNIIYNVTNSIILREDLHKKISLYKKIQIIILIVILVLFILSRIS
jgi:two-component system, OmpR family, response regulator